jgi:hypothetical protein
MIARSLHNGCDERRGGPIATGAVHQQHIWSWVFREILKSNPASQIRKIFSIHSKLLLNGEPGDSCGASLEASSMSSFASYQLQRSCRVPSPSF